DSGTWSIVVALARHEGPAALPDAVPAPFHRRLFLVRGSGCRGRWKRVFGRLRSRGDCDLCLRADVQGPALGLSDPLLDENASGRDRYARRRGRAHGDEVPGVPEPASV